MTDTVAEFGRPAQDTRRVDPDLDIAVPSSLDDIAAELNADPELADVIELEVPGRDRYGIRVRLDFDRTHMNRWRKASADARYPDGFDAGKYNLLLLGEMTAAILRDGDPLELDGTVATFTSPTFQDLLGVQRVADAVTKFYGGREASIASAANAVARAAGWDTEARELDPTKKATKESRRR